MLPRPAALLLVAALSTGCVSFDDPGTSPWPTLERESSLGGTLCFRCGDLYLAEQPEPRTLETLERRGLEVVLDLRDPAVGPGDPIRATALGFGLDYVPLPVPNDGPPDDARVDAFLAELEAAAGRTTLVFCERAATSAMLFAVHRAVAVGVDLDVAIDDGLRIGMKSGPAEDFVREQVARLTAVAAPAAPGGGAPTATGE